MYLVNSDPHETSENLSGMDPRLGHVRGKVTDMDGNGLEHCRIWVRETGRSTYTDSKGNFVLINVPPVVYSLVAESEGYSQSAILDVLIESGDNPGHNFVMFQNYNLIRTGCRRGALALAI